METGTETTAAAAVLMFQRSSSPGRRPPGLASKLLMLTLASMQTEVEAAAGFFFPLTSLTISGVLVLRSPPVVFSFFGGVKPERRQARARFTGGSGSDRSRLPFVGAK